MACDRRLGLWVILVGVLLLHPTAGALSVTDLGTGQVGAKPEDTPCVSWVKFSSSTKYLNWRTVLVAAHTYITQLAPTACIDPGFVIPCYAADANATGWGHHDYNATVLPSDYCRVWINGSVAFATEFYLPQLGPQASSVEWVLRDSGSVVPSNAIRLGSAVLGRASADPPGQCAGAGYTGSVEVTPEGELKELRFAVVSEAVVTSSFDVAVCNATSSAPTAAPPTTNHVTTSVPTTTRAATTTHVPSRAPTTTRAPAASTHVPSSAPTTQEPTAPPTTPSPTFSPTLPPNNRPYIRFGNAIASNHSVTATISQGSTSFTWTNYGFADFSRWVERFDAGEGIMTVFDAATGEKLLKTTVTLTPGPLVVVVKDYWPPSHSYNVETIAASYVPPQSGSGARLFNLSPNTAGADMTSDGQTLASDVLYTLGSNWAPIPVSTATYVVTDHQSGETLATNTITAPPTPFVFTNFLLGVQNATDPSFSTTLVALVDAPEF